MDKLPLHSIVQNLQTLPPEIAHQVFDGLRLWDILRLACHNVEYIDNCIVSHPGCNEIFRTTYPLSLIRHSAQLYWQLCRLMRVSPAPPARWPIANIHLLNYRYTDIRAWLHSEIANLLRLHPWQLDILSRHSPSPADLQGTSSALPDLQQRMTAIQEAQDTINHGRSSQLRRLAVLLENNPDILKRALDPEQVRRPNTAHIATRFRINADRIDKFLIIRDKRGALEDFRYPFLPVVPFDAAYQFVLGLLPKITPDMILGNASLSPDIVSAFDTVLGGLLYFHLHPPWSIPPVPRITRSTTEDLDKGEVHIPKIAIQNARWALTFTQRDEKAFGPHDEREMEWLEAFVVIYRYLKTEHSS